MISAAKSIPDAPQGAEATTNNRVQSPRVVLAHDWLVGYRGGEAVLESIARVLTQRGVTIDSIYTMFDTSRPLAPGGHLIIDTVPKVTPWLNRLPGRLRRWLLPAYPWAVSELSKKLAQAHARRPIDLLISTSSAAIKGLNAPQGVKHICYCHSPARYLWSQQTEYAKGAGGRLRALGLSFFGPALRRWDRQTAAHVDLFLANSSATQAAIRAAYAREAQVLYPPVRTDFFTPDPATPRSTHWLSVGAMEPYKRIDLIIQAAVQAQTRLAIIGTGSQAQALRTLARTLDPAGRFVQFQGQVDDAALRDAYRRAGVLIMPQIEDFGIVAVEAQACGLPVASFAQGGAADWLIEGVTGATFREATPEALIDAAQRALTLPNPAQACRQNSERFAQSVFERHIAAVLDTVL